MYSSFKKGKLTWDAEYLERSSRGWAHKVFTMFKKKNGKEITYFHFSIIYFSINM